MVDGQVKAQDLQQHALDAQDAIACVACDLWGRTREEKKGSWSANLTPLCDIFTHVVMMLCPSLFVSLHNFSLCVYVLTRKLLGREITAQTHTHTSESSWQNELWMLTLMMRVAKK